MPFNWIASNNNLPYHENSLLFAERKCLILKLKWHVHGGNEKRRLWFHLFYPFSSDFVFVT